MLRNPTPPGHIAARLPPLALLQDTLLAHVATIETRAPITRAAWNSASILPARVERTYRFGPPAAMRGADGSYPFHWIYAADDVYTAAWEAGLCLNDAEQPGTFYIERGARTALIATLAFGTPLKLVDLNGLASSKLGIFDEISSCDHEWCQWFGAMVDQVIAGCEGRVHGMLYPSRKHRGHDAIAMSSRVLGQLAPHVTVDVRHFGTTAAYQALRTDRCCQAPP
ncbi:RES domain-containing protein [Massilia soli]|uniref:RES domain-containing protein n=1 Tax=Massilia soli TaxID=2792854 RepID=A0ABS7SJT2_9BURK|nr:RES domain-containing protein [Massilia soli]MBZ2205952.1 RES domain-containing protein [Massilia soli]